MSTKVSGGGGETRYFETSETKVHVVDIVNVEWMLRSSLSGLIRQKNANRDFEKSSQC